MSLDKLKIRSAAHTVSKILSCEEDDLEDRLIAAAPSGDDLDVWLSRLKEGAFLTAMMRNRLTEQFLHSVHRYEWEEPLAPHEGAALHQVSTGIG